MKNIHDKTHNQEFEQYDTIQEIVQPAYDEDIEHEQRYTEEEINTLISKWLDKPKKVALTMIEEYGFPQEATPDRLIWHNNGIWKYSLLENAEIPHDFPEPHSDMLLQVVNYRVSPDKYRDLGWFDGSVVIDRTKGELGARCGGQAMNYVALNIAHDIITGKRDVENARDFYAQTAQNYKQGITSDYTEGLLFEPSDDYVGDVDFDFDRVDQ